MAEAEKDAAKAKPIEDELEKNAQCVNTQTSPQISDNAPAVEWPKNDQVNMYVIVEHKVQIVKENVLMDLE